MPEWWVQLLTCPGSNPPSNTPSASALLSFPNWHASCCNLESKHASNRFAQEWLSPCNLCTHELPGCQTRIPTPTLSIVWYEQGSPIPCHLFCVSNTVPTPALRLLSLNLAHVIPLPWIPCAMTSQVPSSFRLWFRDHLLIYILPLEQSRVAVVWVFVLQEFMFWEFGPLCGDVGRW
jgi:hypothetical protein